MNYIRHMNAFFTCIKNDNRLSSTHVSLYMALFQYWNFNRFSNPFSVYRENIIQLSKLSKNTYHKCLKQLHELKYIYYHPSPSRFHPVRISIIQLDGSLAIRSKFTQLNLFDVQGNSGTNFTPHAVSELRPAGLNDGTVPVTDLRHIIKPNKNKKEKTPSDKYFTDDKKSNSSAVSGSIEPGESCLATVTNLGHVLSGEEQAGFISPPLSEVEKYFEDKQYSLVEGRKFFNHYKALDWKIQGRTRISNWKALADKWMLNASRWNKGKLLEGEKQLMPVQALYLAFLEGQNISKSITGDHFNVLRLSVKNETISKAIQKRIAQVSGTNEYTLTQLWNAYLKNNPDDELVKKDMPNVMKIAMKLEVINHFHTLKEMGVQTIQST